MGLITKDGVDAFKRVQVLSRLDLVQQDKEFLAEKYHPQGIAITKNRFFISYNTKEQGIIYEYNRHDMSFVNKYTDLGESGFGHPGSIQAADNILIVPTQTSCGTGADIVLYNTYNLQDKLKIPTEKEDNIGNAGIALYEINGNMRKYFILANYKSWWLTVTDGNLKDATISPAIPIRYAEDGLTNGQSENVYVDCNGNIFVIVAKWNAGKNIIQLQRLNILSNEYKRIVVEKKEIGNGYGANCNAAVGIEVIDDSIKMYVTNKPGSGQTKVFINRNDCFGTTVQRDSGGINGIKPLELIAFDYEHSGKQDYILARLNDGRVKIFKHREGDHFETVYEDDAQSGISEYGRLTSKDKILAFDYDKTNKLDHLVIYRPGDGRIWILKHDDHRFEPVFKSDKGIGGYDLKDLNDHAFVYDYESSGRMDYLVFYRPGSERIMILRHDGPNFNAVYNKNDLGGYDLKSGGDRGFAFDYDCSGKMDHIAFYRPGSKTMWIMKRQGNNFLPVYCENNKGIGLYDLCSMEDRALAFDLLSNGQMSSMILYRPGTNVLWAVGKKTDSEFQPFIKCHQIPGYQISYGDRVIAFDFNHIGRLDHWIVYNPDNGKFWVYHKYT